MNASTTLRRAALAAATLATLGTAAAPASAVQKTLNYQCEWPLVGALPLKAEIDVASPAAVGTGPVPALPVTLRLTSGTNENGTSSWVGLKVIKAVSLESPSDFPSGPEVTISGADLIAPLKHDLPLTIERYLVPLTEQDVVLNATTTIPAVSSAGNGTLTYKLTNFKLRLRGYKADGSLVKPPPVTNWEQNESFFDVPCTLDAGQDPTLGTVEVGGATPTPTPTPSSTPIPEPTPLPLPSRTVYDATGAATLKTLTKGTLPLRGSLDLRTNSVPVGQFVADVTLAPTTARLVALGFIPVTAAVQFVPSGQATGVIKGAGLTGSQNFRIKLPQVSLFGTIPLAGGTTCQTRQLSTVDLAGPGFTLAGGGTVTGTFAISDLSGCGALNGLVSPLTAGGGNTVSLKLTPPAPRVS